MSSARLMLRRTDRLQRDDGNCRCAQPHISGEWYDGTPAPLLCPTCGKRAAVHEETVDDFFGTAFMVAERSALQAGGPSESCPAPVTSAAG